MVHAVVSVHSLSPSCWVILVDIVVAVAVDVDAWCCLLAD